MCSREPVRISTEKPAVPEAGTENLQCGLRLSHLTHTKKAPKQKRISTHLKEMARFRTSIDEMLM